MELLNLIDSFVIPWAKFNSFLRELMSLFLLVSYVSLWAYSY